MLVGCGGPQNADRAAAEFLGPESVYVLMAPDRVQGWNFQRPDGSIMSDPPIRLLDPAIGRELAGILLDQDSYRHPAGGGAFERSVGFRVWRGREYVDVYPSFANDQVSIKYAGQTASPTSTLAGVRAARDRLLAVAKRAFPEYRPPK